MENSLSDSHGVNPVSNSSLSIGRSVSIDQAAQLLQVSRRTIYYRISSGQLQTIRTLGGSQRVLVESLSTPTTSTPATSVASVTRR